ncbi:MAG: HNH endonuclease [Bradymonadales bacterium]|nr:MAG: HNH endonuclease [Bradymonadales bacterium]
MKDMNFEENSVEDQALPLNLQKLASKDLLLYTQKLAASERKIYAAVIEALEEIERRKLYLAKGYSSLFLFCTEVLKYSAGAAQRRIESMRLIKNFPRAQKTEVKTKLQKGSLSLSHLSQVSKALRSLPPQSCHEKMQLLSRIENTTQRECERKLIEAGVPEIKKREDFRVVSESSYRLSVTVDEETKVLLEKFMALTAHQNPWGSKERAIKIALDLALREVEKRKFGVRGEKSGDSTKEDFQARAGEGALRETGSSSGASASVEVKSSISEKGKTWGIKSENLESSRVQAASATEFVSAAGGEGVKLGTKGKRSRHIPKSVRAEVWKRDAGACVFVEPRTGRPCGSSFGLEWDHILEFSRGGESSEGNLRLLCRQHNNRRSCWEREPPEL